MDCLAATYEWKQLTTADTNASSSFQQQQACRCPEMSSAELELQQMKAKVVLALCRDRVRKMSETWLNKSQSRQPTAAPIRFEWKVEPSELVHHLCHWQHTSALTRIGMTSCLAELSRLHRRLEGTSPEPPPSKNKLTLVVWNLAAIVQAKLSEWQACVEAAAEESFISSIVIRTSDLVPLWTWEADFLRHRPALLNVCDRMLSMELWQYRQWCNQLTKREKRLARGGQVTPYLTPFGLRWPTADDALKSMKTGRRASLEPNSSSAAAPAVTVVKSRLKLSELSIDAKPLNSSNHSKPSNPVDPSKPSSNSSKSSLSEFSNLSKFTKSSKRSQVSKSAASGGTPSQVFAGETFCVSGPFTVDQEAMLALISRHVTSTVTRKCTYLVADQIGSAKTRKAQANGIPIVTEAWIRASIAEGKKSTDTSLLVNGVASSSENHKRAAFTKFARGVGASDEDDGPDIESNESEQSENVSDSELVADSAVVSEPESADESRSDSELDETSEEDDDSNRQEQRLSAKSTSTSVKPRSH